uniref:Uncharacterized protein n=1 Tax=Chromera velia CCMP2878 TaxID=1169474 RepID=A0A0K6S7X1_9ALVE|eukprot:Cvel_4784.t2-p1 / transcript=Cvel_4784.t2 / gene=Cvel_4784 / organism=Chromera_velia_CCMP2878 / gene_product=hypothetical protein / transcript_product=hypothetical protein / location=Cvel_scaffold214:128-868(+) / protein_length=247 / sequence_SO=supercontig / SO=protein_coding / is_pseudo=false
MDVGSSKPFSPPTPPEVPQAPVHFIHLFLEGDFSENLFGLSAQTVCKLFDLCVQEDLPCCHGADFVRQRGLEAVFHCDMTEKHANDVIAARDGRSLFSVRGYGDAFPSCKVRLRICRESYLSELEQEECNVQRSLQQLFSLLPPSDRMSPRLRFTAQMTTPAVVSNSAKKSWRQRAWDQIQDEIGFLEQFEEGEEQASSRENLSFDMSFPSVTHAVRTFVTLENHPAGEGEGDRPGLQKGKFVATWL